ncbi:MAG: hypothetical protein PHI12_13240 [Dehalococcoidales bacterium]|nr:hypothetical protein [Dehalococcoidales bacterium]
MRLSREAFLKLVEDVLPNKQTISDGDLMRVISVVNLCQREAIAKRPRGRRRKNAEKAAEEATE